MSTRMERRVPSPSFPPAAFGGSTKRRNPVEFDGADADAYKKSLESRSIQGSDDLFYRSDDETSDDSSITEEGFRNMIINLSSVRESPLPENGNKTASPAVVWSAKVFQTQYGRPLQEYSKRKAILIYNDDQPITFPIISDSLQGPIKADESGNLRWIEPVMTVEVYVEANLHLDRGFNAKSSTLSEIPTPVSISSKYLDLHSPFLRQSLREVIQYYPRFHEQRFRLANNQEPKIEEPFAVLFHHFENIKEIAEEVRRDVLAPETKIKKDHMKHLLDFLEPIYQEHILPCRNDLAKSVPRIAFHMIWYLFAPGLDVYIANDSSPYAAVVSGVSQMPMAESYIWGEGNKGAWIIDLWTLETDGTRIERSAYQITVDPYSGLRDVTSLPICPVNIWDKFDGSRRRGNILRQGATFFKALRRGNLLAHYDGPTGYNGQLYQGNVIVDHRRGLEERKQEPILRRVGFTRADRFGAYDYIFIRSDSPRHRAPSFRQSPMTSNTADLDDLHHDYATYATYEGREDRSSNNHGSRNTKVGGQPDRHYVDELTEHQLLLLSTETYAYALRNKQWMEISLGQVSEFTPSVDSLENLIISQDELKTIQALSHRQNSKTKHWAADFIEGKGSGQVILLHGPPGVGKTYTVGALPYSLKVVTNSHRTYALTLGKEAIAEWLHRPLLSLTIADIGTVETLVEGELVKWFDLAEAWNAVLLVDEADIFLERRQNRDLARNGLVTAFLRRMEYFKGLVFLTTNRVGQIDDAFISRVHVAVGYKALDAETRRKVWSGFFRKLRHDQAGRIQIAPDAKKWVLETTGDTQLNGRDIRNALQTAITLAEFEREEDPDYQDDGGGVAAGLVTIVTRAHFEKVLGMCNQFRTYVTSIRREDEQRRAQGRGDRNDYGGDVGDGAPGANEMMRLMRLDEGN